MAINPSDESQRLPDGFDAAMGHVWAWYAMHANQRMQMVNFYLVATSFLALAYITALTSGWHAAAAAVALAGAAACVIFNLLDARTRELIKGSESALAQLESRLVKAGFMDTDLHARTHEGLRSRPSYRTSINVLTSIGVFGFLVALTAAVASAA